VPVSSVAMLAMSSSSSVNSTHVRLMRQAPIIFRRLLGIASKPGEVGLCGPSHPPLRARLRLASVPLACDKRG
jgi:hypothetical protein